jgi:hypothetical protein
MKSRSKDVGIYRPHHRWSFSSNVRFGAPTPVAPKPVASPSGEGGS